MIDWNMKLFRAARCGNITAMEKALKNGADINKPISLFPLKTALNEAIRNQQIKSIEWLLNKNVEITDDCIYSFTVFNITETIAKMIELLYCCPQIKTLHKARLLVRLRVQEEFELINLLKNKERLSKLKRLNDRLEC